MPEGNGEAKPGGLEAIFPGKSVVLKSGKVVTVRPWGADVFLHRMQPRIAQMIGAVMPILAGIDSTDALRARVPSILTATLGTLTDIVQETAELKPEDLRAMTAAEFAGIARLVIEENLDFFGELTKIANLAGLKGLVGPRSAPASSKAG